MNTKILYVIVMTLLAGISRVAAQALPVWDAGRQRPVRTDWLIHPTAVKAGVFRSTDGRDLILYNGLVKRVFRLSPDLACTDLINLHTGKELLRAVKEEARVTINGQVYPVGGLKGQPEMAYLLPNWLNGMQAAQRGFHFVSFETRPLVPAPNPSSPRFWSLHRNGATGIEAVFLYRSELPGLDVRVHYELYDGLPLIVKWLSITNHGPAAVKVDGVVNEVLGMVEEESSVVGSLESLRKPQGVYFESNFAFNNAMNYAHSDQTTHWKPDSSYTSQVHFSLKTPCLLEIYPEHGPGSVLNPGDSFNSIRTHELLLDGEDRESRGLAIRRMYGAVAPWTSANPIFMHIVSRTDQDVRQAVDQCAATGYEALIVSFASHLHIEDTTQANLLRWKQLADYAHRKHIAIGCYSLFSSRHISDADDVIDPQTGKPDVSALFGAAPCFGSKWGLWYRDAIKNFFSQTGFDLFEHDGPYAGDVCASTSHPGHRGLEDSQWEQMKIQKELYHWLSARGVYINAPDWYLLDGTNKIALGYREVNFSLPRGQQKILNRQNIFDGTWEKTPAMSWGFVPLSQYQGGGAAATIEPLSAHLMDYEQLMVQYYGAGIQACYRGPRLYDTEATRRLVSGVINWYKQYRDILNSDIVHLRRADGRDWDGILHVNPALRNRGLLMLYNPTKAAISRTVRIPLYYTGLSHTAAVRERGAGPAVTHYLKRDYSIDLTFRIGPENYTWFVIGAVKK